GPAELAAAVTAGAPIDAVRLRLVPPPGGTSPHAVHDTLTRALELTRRWLAEDALAGVPLVVLTSGAVAVADGEDVRDLGAAAAWGLLRSAQSEAPGRLVLADVHDPDAPGLDAVLSAAVTSGEPQVAIRPATEPRAAAPSATEPQATVSPVADAQVAVCPPAEQQAVVRSAADPQAVVRPAADSRVLVPRLVRAGRAGRPAAPVWDPDGTALITGGTGSLGALFARHLVTAHGVRHLLLVSRRGADAPRAGALREELTALGATVAVAACDVSDRDALAAVLAAIPAEHPLRGIVHTAGVLDDGVIGAQNPERLARVLGPKADAAWHLHDLTRDHDLTAFVLFSSIAALVGGPGQSTYAAANAFLDALARHRAAHGLAATSLSWGLWAQASELTGDLTETDLRRIARSGFKPVETAQGLALFDLALRLGRP
ncbi:SDR family NAD(P)-dependent oxidoreductase, partial [Streptomyces seoulensis]